MNNKKEYAYLSCIGGEIKNLSVKWRSTSNEMHENMRAMHAAAYVFKKTAAILVYEHKESDRWEYVDDFQAGFVRKPQYITITKDNIILYD